MLCRFDHGRMLGLAHDEFFTLVARLCRHHTDHGEVVRLRAGCGEDELLALGAKTRFGRAECGKDLILCLGNGFFGKKPHFMQGGGVAVGIRHHLRHFGDRLGAERGGGAVVKINFVCHIRLPFSRINIRNWSRWSRLPQDARRRALPVRYRSGYRGIRSKRRNTA